MDGRVTISGSMCAGVVTACETSLGNGAGLGGGPKRMRWGQGHILGRCTISSIICSNQRGMYRTLSCISSLAELQSLIGKGCP